MSPWSQNFQLCEPLLFILKNLFTNDSYVHQRKDLPDCPFKSKHRLATFSIRTLRCACWLRGTLLFTVSQNLYHTYLKGQSHKIPAIPTVSPYFYHFLRDSLLIFLPFFKENVSQYSNQFLSDSLKRFLPFLRDRSHNIATVSLRDSLTIFQPLLKRQSHNIATISLRDSLTIFQPLLKRRSHNIPTIS